VVREHTVGSAGNTFSDLSIRDVLEPHQRVTTNGNSPLHRTPDIGAEQVAIDANHSVWKWWNRKAAKCGPHHRRRRNVATRERGVRRTQRVTDEHRRSRTKSAAEKKVESRAVGSSGAHGTVTPSGDVAFLIVPFENEVTVA
jgi:hypothetical protein